VKEPFRVNEKGKLFTGEGDEALKPEIADGQKSKHEVKSSKKGGEKKKHNRTKAVFKGGNPGEKSECTEGRHRINDR